MNTPLIDLAEHEIWFRRYAQTLRGRESSAPGPMDLKLKHTFAVLARARRIVTEEALPERLTRAAELAALYHDVARFEQYLRWHTFKDSASVNHGLFGAQLLKRLNRLDGEAKETRTLVLAAVALHNRYAVPAGVPPEVRLITCVVRDADKLDILRVMDEYFSGSKKDGTVVLNVKDEPDKFTPAVLDKALSGGLASYSQLRYENDFRVLLGTWIHDLNFAPSRRMMAEEGHIQRILGGLPDMPELTRARDFLLAQINSGSTAACPRPPQG